MHDEDGTFLGRVPPVPVDEERMAWACTVVTHAITEALWADPAAAELLARPSRSGSAPSAGSPLFRRCRLRYDEPHDALIMLLGVEGKRTVSIIPGPTLRQGSPELS